MVKYRESPNLSFVVVKEGNCAPVFTFYERTQHDVLRSGQGKARKSRNSFLSYRKTEACLVYFSKPLHQFILVLQFNIRSFFLPKGDSGNSHTSDRVGPVAFLTSARCAYSKLELQVAVSS